MFRILLFNGQVGSSHSSALYSEELIVPYDATWITWSF